jgi:CheY-like chemotaxis protein
MHIHTAICDDAALEREYLRNLLEKWALRENLNIKISDFDSAESFLFAYDQDKSFDILLLDIQMKAIDGVTLARRLRREAALADCFHHRLPRFYRRGYDVSALHYLMKPVSEQKLFEVLGRAVGQMKVSERTVLLPLHDGNYRLRADESFMRRSFRTVFSCIRYRGPSAEHYNGRAGNLIGRRFFPLPQVYIAGLRHVRKVTRTALELDNGAERRCPASSTMPPIRRLYSLYEVTAMPVYAWMAHSPR